MLFRSRLSNLLSESSKGRYGKDTAVIFREAAKSSIGSLMPAKSLELKHTIKLIHELTIEIDEIETAIKRIMDEEIQSPILTIPGISYRMGAMIIADLEKKRSEGKHYNVALSHATKKLVRLIFAMKKSRRAYIPVP